MEETILKLKTENDELRRKLEHLHSAVKIRTHRLVGYCLEVGA